MTQFFGYWGGSLPPVTNLHFRSFIHFHPNSKYDLWLDADVGQSIPSDLNWLKTHPQINIRVFSLKQLVSRYVTPLSQTAEGILFERRVFHSTCATEDQKEGMAAFLEKRKPVFKNR